MFEPRVRGLDTLEIPTYLGYAEMKHVYQALEPASFFLREGDTVLVKYNAAGRPTLFSKVYPDYTDLYNLPYEQADAIQDRDYYIETVLTHSQYGVAYKYFHNKADQIKYPDLKEVMGSCYVNLDSLSTVYEHYQSVFRSVVDSLYEVQAIDSLYHRYLIHRFIPKERYSSEEVVRSDSLLRYVSHYYVARTYLGADTGKPLISFDRIAKDTIATPLARKGILKRLLNKVLTDEGGWHHYPKDIKNRYVQKYSEITGDSLVVQQILQNATDVASLKSVLPLETPEGQKISLEKILAKNKGNVVYVDFWASWCAPCLGQLPYSEALHKRLTGQNIEFLYISVDTNRKAWLDKVREHSDMLADSYRILDTDVDFLKQIKLDKIPRYLIYDRNGILVDQDAPRPSDEEIERSIMTFLNEKKTRP